MGSQNPSIHIVGAGLAGSECALQLAALGHSVVLYEMRGQTLTPAHRTDQCAELVCSNSFGSLSNFSAPGQLKWEAEQLGSQILECAWNARVPGGQALAMDRDLFAKEVTERVKNHPRIRVETKVIHSLEEIPRPAVIATGPLTHDPLAQSLRAHFGDEFLYFFDAIAPIVDADSINMEIAWRADRWDKGLGDGDYLNCPMTREQYLSFAEAVMSAKKIEAKEFEKNTPYFDGCMPIEEMFSRGIETPRYGPMSAKGLRNPRTGLDAYAVVQLRQENRERTSYNMVGFQTKMAYADQKEVFRTIPGLESAEFLKLGSIHRNLFINSPMRLRKDLSSPADPFLFFAGQITGVEGYFESACTGWIVAHTLHRKLRSESPLDLPRATAFGSLLNAITDHDRADIFQPTNINFGLLPAVEGERDKLRKRELQLTAARGALLAWMPQAGFTIKPQSFVSTIGNELSEAGEKFPRKPLSKPKPKPVSAQKSV